MAQPKSVVVTFRVDPHLAEALERIPDKSSFIRDALRNSLHEPCPACAGTGRVDCDSAEWLSKLLASKGARNCECCGAAFPPERAARSASSPAASKSGARRAPAAELATCGHCGPEGHRH